MLDLFLVCAPGLERLLVQELTALGLSGLTRERGGVFVRASAASELSMCRVDALLPLFESGQAPRGGRPTGSTPGPRLVLEYHLHSCSPDASSVHVGEDNAVES